MRHFCQKLSLVFLLLAIGMGAIAAPESFREAKDDIKQFVYLDRNSSDFGTVYCGCQWRWVGSSGGRIDHGSCGYDVRKQENRAARIEWEHVVPASHFGHYRQCWQEGGRRHCRQSDPVFRAMEADMHNLVPSVGEVNADRSNFHFGEVANQPDRYGECTANVDFKNRRFEPRDEVKGMVARIAFYVHDRYDIRMSRQQQQLLMAWDRQYPVTEWERLREYRIAKRMGHRNEFVTGDRQWRPGYQNRGAGVKKTGASTDPGDQPVRGNRNSRVYHFPEGCPSYDRIAPHNIVNFDSPGEAESAGYRKAGNCR